MKLKALSWKTLSFEKEEARITLSSKIEVSLQLLLQYTGEKKKKASRPSVFFHTDCCYILPPSNKSRNTLPKSMVTQSLRSLQ